MRLKDNRGFTIVELMIALSVLATILTMSTVILIQIGGIYSKGVNEANLQNTTRGILSSLSSSVQFSGFQPDPCTKTSTSCYAASQAVGPLPHFTAYAFCIGTTRYTYTLNHELGTDQATNYTTAHVLWRDTLTDEHDACAPLDLSQTTPSDGSTVAGSGSELMSNHMLLTNFRVYQSSASSDIWDVNVWTAYGDSDLITIQSSGQANCHGGVDTQYCATSQLSTTLIGRIY